MNFISAAPSTTSAALAKKPHTFLQYKLQGLSLGPVEIKEDCKDESIALGIGEILPGAGQGCWRTEEPLLWPSVPRREEDDTLLANS